MSSTPLRHRISVPPSGRIHRRPPFLRRASPRTSSPSRGSGRPSRATRSEPSPFLLRDCDYPSLPATPLVDEIEMQAGYEIALIDGHYFRACEVNLAESQRTESPWLHAVVYMRRRPGPADWELINEASLDIPVSQILYISRTPIVVLDDPQMLAATLAHDQPESVKMKAASAQRAAIAVA